ncbi:integral membrane protein [Zymoseptoria brevis]|uniref:Integral membrane protein n=1 Tax=Zymoseptoria brevis TaxID=1047168 RepID=A0A0F4GAR8_9PEZI|nr:integral membrane protein [Zymoseptoria brevis]
MSLFRTTIQSALLSAVSNVVAQLISSWQSNTPFTLDVVRLLQFVTFSVIACPPNYVWQRFLESKFPAYPSDQQSGLSKKSDEKSSAKPVSKQLSIKNTAIKFSLDQTIGAAVNTVMFIAGIALLRGESLDTAIRNVQEQYFPMQSAGLKLWPAVSILSFAVIPLEHRMLFGSVAGLFWGVFLSMTAGSSGHK